MSDGTHFFPADRYKNFKRTVTLPDGSKRILKRPIQHSELAVDPAGHVVYVPLYTGPSQHAEEDPYRVSIVRAKTKAGFLFLSSCPQAGNYDARQALPPYLRNRPMCTSGEKGGPITQDNPCACIGEAIKVRQKINAEAMAAIEGKARAQADRDREIQKQILEETREQNRLLASGALVAKAKGKGE